MSTDLQVLQDLPRIRLSPIEIVKQQASNTTEDVTSCVVGQKGDEESSESSCRTPTSEESKIPAKLCCPPAPKKPKRTTVSFKRKLAELQFFEIEKREEIEAFFQSSFELEGIRSSMKRNCRILT